MTKRRQSQSFSEDTKVEDVKDTPVSAKKKKTKRNSLNSSTFSTNGDEPASVTPKSTPVSAKKLKKEIAANGNSSMSSSASKKKSVKAKKSEVDVNSQLASPTSIASAKKIEETLVQDAKTGSTKLTKALSYLHSWSKDRKTWTFKKKSDANLQKNAFKADNVSCIVKCFLRNNHFFVCINFIVFIGKPNLENTSLPIGEVLQFVVVNAGY